VTTNRKAGSLSSQKIASNRRVGPDDTTIVVSVKDRSQRDLTRRFENTDIDWITVEQQQLAWDPLYNLGKKLLQPGNCEWVTVTECTNTSGWVLPPCVIFEGKVFIESWFDGLPSDWRCEVSPNEWTFGEVGLRWLEKLLLLRLYRVRKEYIGF
jgi:hypothetical protein